MIAETERQIAATTDARSRVDALGTSLAEIERIASVVSFDKDQKLRSAIDQTKAALTEARNKVDELDDARLTGLESAFGRLAKAARDMAEATTGIGGGFGGMDLSGYADGLSATRAMIQKYEGWAPVAKWDENANRGGWGSSTVTLSDGSQRTLQKGEAVNKADADRDLDRRIRGYFEEQQRVADQPPDEEQFFAGLLPTGRKGQRRFALRGRQPGKGAVVGNRTSHLGSELHGYYGCERRADGLAGRIQSSRAPRPMRGERRHALGRNQGAWAASGAMMNPRLDRADP